MNVRKILIGAVILGALVAYIRAVELPRDESKINAAQPLRGVSPQEFVEIVIVRDGETFRLVNDRVEPPAIDPKSTPDPVTLASIDRAKSWRLADVPAGGLDKGAINSLLTSLVGITFDTPIPQTELDPDLGVYGLKEPRLALTAKRETASYEIRFGSLNEYVSKRYVGFGGEVYLVADGLFTAADKAREQFRNRTPIDFADSELAAVSISGPNDELAFVSDESYRWRMTRPADYPVSDVAMATLGRSLRNLRVADFVDAPESLERYGLTKPKLSVKLDFRPDTRPEPLVIELGNTTGAGPVETYLRLGGGSAIFRLSTDPTETIVKRPDEFRERAIFRFPAERVERVMIERPDVQKLELTRQDAEWTVNGRPGDRPFVEQVVRGIAGLQADGFPPAGAEPSFVPLAGTFTLTVRGEKVGEQPTIYTLTFGGRAMDGQRETGYYGRVNDAKEPFIVSAGTLKVLTPLYESLVKTTGEFAGDTAVVPTPTVASAD